MSNSDTMAKRSRNGYMKLGKNTGPQFLDLSISETALYT